jgi:hypothetical protein
MIFCANGPVALSGAERCNPVTAYPEPGVYYAQSNVRWFRW